MFWFELDWLGLVAAALAIDLSSFFSIFFIMCDLSFSIRNWRYPLPPFRNALRLEKKLRTSEMFPKVCHMQWFIFNSETILVARLGKICEDICDTSSIACLSPAASVQARRHWGGRDSHRCPTFSAKSQKKRTMTVKVDDMIYLLVNLSPSLPVLAYFLLSCTQKPKKWVEKL